MSNTTIEVIKNKDIGSFGEGFKKALPIVIGYIPIAFSFGVIARGAGLNMFEIFLMSLLVYAGSSQFIAVGLFATGAGFAAIVSTTFLVNLRHLLMSASLAPYFKGFPTKILPLISYGITDETFAVSSTYFKETKPTVGFTLGLHGTAQISWVLGSIIGGVFYHFVGDIASLGLDFVLYAMFVFLLVIQIKNKRLIMVAIISGAMALLLYKLLNGNQWYIILATVFAATLGVLIEWKEI